MDYREVKEKHHQEHYRQGEAHTVSQLLAIPKVRKPQHGDHWGNWELDTERWVLTHRKGHYECDLEYFGQYSSGLLDFIFQVRQKVWHTNDDMVALIEAFDDLLEPQANLCSFGQSKRLENPAEVLLTNAVPFDSKWK